MQAGLPNPLPLLQESDCSMKNLESLSFRSHRGGQTFSEKDWEVNTVGSEGHLLQLRSSATGVREVL